MGFLFRALGESRVNTTRLFWVALFQPRLDPSISASGLVSNNWLERFVDHQLKGLIKVGLASITRKMVAKTIDGVIFIRNFSLEMR